MGKGAEGRQKQMGGVKASASTPGFYRSSSNKGVRSRWAGEQRRLAEFENVAVNRNTATLKYTRYTIASRSFRQGAAAKVAKLAARRPIYTLDDPGVSRRHTR